MTTNQTIDGVLVSRELLERIREKLSQTDYTWPARDPEEELRALLDADKVNNRQMGLMQYVEAHPVKPVAQPQGEPVAWCIDREEPGHLGGYCSAAMKVNGVGFQGHTKPLYAEQPAPVAVMVPKSECPNCLGDSMFGCDSCIPDFSPGNGNKARRRAESLGLMIPAAPTAYDGFDNGVD